LGWTISGQKKDRSTEEKSEASSLTSCRERALSFPQNGKDIFLIHRRQQFKPREEGSRPARGTDSRKGKQRIKTLRVSALGRPVGRFKSPQLSSVGAEARGSQSQLRMQSGGSNSGPDRNPTDRPARRGCQEDRRVSSGKMCGYSLGTNGCSLLRTNALGKNKSRYVFPNARKAMWFARGW